MSAFWGGFAGEGVRQLDKLREDNTVKLRIEDARKYQEGRYSLERADRKADNIEEDNRKLKLAEADDFAGIYDAGDGNYMRNAKAVGADGTITITPTQVKDPSLIQKWKEYDAAKKQKAEEDTWELRGKKARTLEDEYNLSTAPEKHSLDMQRGRADIAASNRSGRDKDSSIKGELPEYAYKAINGLAAGDGSYEYTGTGMYKGKKFNARDMARIAADPTHPSHLGAIVVMREEILPKTNKKIKEEN